MSLRALITKISKQEKPIDTLRESEDVASVPGMIGKVNLFLEETKRSQRVRKSYEDVLGGEPPDLAGMEAIFQSI